MSSGYSFSKPKSESAPADAPATAPVVTETVTPVVNGSGGEVAPQGPKPWREAQGQVKRPAEPTTEPPAAPKAPDVEGYSTDLHGEHPVGRDNPLQFDIHKKP